MAIRRCARLVEPDPRCRLHRVEPHRWQPKRIFVDDLISAGVTPGDRPVVFLCRSGNRSIGAAEAATEAGIAPSYNVLDGFEGNLDERKHRGGTGWKAVGLPWKQS